MLNRCKMTLKDLEMTLQWHYERPYKRTTLKTFSNFQETTESMQRAAEMAALAAAAAARKEEEEKLQQVFNFFSNFFLLY